MQQLKPKQHAVVIGGGIVGVCCALYLQREGHQVSLVDPAVAGDSTAKWSCGQMAIGEVVPLSKPGILKKIPGWLMDQKGPLALRPGALPTLLPWFVRFLLNARHSNILQIADELSDLTQQVYQDYQVLLDACDDKQLLINRPVLEVFDHADGIEEESEWLALREQLGFNAERLNGDDIADLEPALAGKFQHGLRFGDWRFVRDTEGFIQALTAQFLANGGQRIQVAADAITEQQGHATGVILSDGQTLAADHVVVAAGNGSRRFFKQLGVNIPLQGIAGYQVVLPQAGVEFTHSVIYADGGFVFAPMDRGLQIGGTIEFSGADAEPNFKRSDIILEKARRILPQLDVTHKEYGIGIRPFLPDTKPVIDVSPRLSNVAICCGHGQLGLTLGATSGRLVADLLHKRTPAQSVVPFRANRF